MKFANSILLNTDSYKVGMDKMYPPGTQYVYSYIESRGDQHDETLFFGLQAFMKEYLTKPITQEEIDYAAEVWAAHGEPFNREGWEYILKEHNGYLPIEIRAVEEGLVIPCKNVLATIQNTDKMVPWLTTWIETSLLRAIWYPTTVATQSWNIKQIIKQYLEKSGDPTTIGFKLHDFGARGVSSLESAGIGGASHLVNFMGTDTITGVLFAREYYNADIAGFSIPASEHSVITSWGRSGEADAYANMIDQFGKPGTIFACVSDSYDIYEACRMWSTGTLKHKVIDSGATVVIRPDSGDPIEVLPKMIQILSEGFGYTKNDKGYKVLNNVRIIWGDGINQLSIQSILRTMVDMFGWSADNFAFGMGGALLQIVNRDTYKFALKCSAMCRRVDTDLLGKEEWIDVYKDPITDKGKKSKKGLVTLMKNSDGKYYSGVADWTKSELDLVFQNGVVIKTLTFDQIRQNSEK